MRLLPVPMKTGLLVGGEQHIDFCTLCVKMALWGLREGGLSLSLFEAHEYSFTSLIKILI